MTFDRIISLISTVALAYFAFGTWRIDRTLCQLKADIAEIKDIMKALREDPDQ